MALWRNIKSNLRRHPANNDQQDTGSKTYQDDLCVSCSQVITTVTTTRMKLGRSSILCKRYSTLYEFMHSDCLLCQFFGRLKMEVPANYSSAELYTQVKHQSMDSLNPDSADYDDLKSGPFLVFQTVDNFKRARGLGSFGVLYPMFANDDLKPRRVEPLAIESSILREWLSFCDLYHHETCQPKPGRNVIGFKVLDCQTRRVVEPDLDCKYVALSYTWGSGVSEQAQDTFPRTIEDSISVTLELGFHYLWVDKYCIDQSDINEKHNQIQHMDIIYSNADLTIVAAAGNNPDYGLPGVSSRARKEQKRLVLNGVELVQIYSDGEDLRLSSWASRAWTLQEGYLAKRRLIFTDHEVLYLCEHMYCQESVHQKLHHRTHRTAGARDGLDGTHLYSIVPNRNWESFTADRVLAEYSRRELSFDSDALNACLGILNATKISHWFGMPIEPDRNRRGSYMLHLQWRTKDKSCHQRIGFPSWSWASVSGEKAFPNYKSQVACTISVQDLNHNWLTIDEWMHSGGDSALLKNSPCIRIHSYVWKLTIASRLMDHDVGGMHAGPLDFGIYIHLDLSVQRVYEFLSDAVALLLQFQGKKPPYTSAVALILKPFGDRYRRVGITNWDDRISCSPAVFEERHIEKRTLYIE